MQHVLVETHCHTLASTHAYSTLAEMASYAKKIGLEGIAITDHAPAIADSPHMWHFHCQKFWPPYMEDIRVYKGAEVNILDEEGTVDIPQDVLARMDIVIASAHQGVTPNMDYEQTTHSYLALLNNPDIDVLGHSGTPAYLYDINRVVKQAAAADKIIEINNHSFVFRKKSVGNCIQIAKAAKKFGTKICVSTDAHICYELGHVEDALAMLTEIDFPEELIVNRNKEVFDAYVNAHKPKQNNH